jgi:gluconate 5-dehydrogenase
MNVLDRFRPDGRVALVTGASHGIGEGLSLSLAYAVEDEPVPSAATRRRGAGAAAAARAGRRSVAAPGSRELG